MKKLFQINTVCNSGSTGRIAENIAKIAAVDGWDNYVAFGRNSQKSQAAKMYQVGTQLSFYLNVLGARFFDNDGFLNSANTRKLVKYIDSVNPSIVHIHNLHGYYTDIRVLFDYIKNKGIPTVITLHDCWLFTGHCSYFTFNGCDKWRKVCEKCPQKKGYPKSLLFDNSTENFLVKKSLFEGFDNLVLVPVSDWLSGLLANSFLKDKRKVVIKNGIDLSVFKPTQPDEMFCKKYQIPNRFKILGVANVWGQRKGLQDFISLSKKLLQDEVVVLVGLNKKQASYIKRNFENIVPIERTENVGDLAKLYSVCDVLFNPTYEDNYPTTNLEAQACGTPVVAYKTGGACESLDAEYGFEINQGDLSTALKVIRNVKGLNKEKMRNTLVLKSQKEFGSDVCFRNYIRLYDEIICGE